MLHITYTLNGQTHTKDVEKSPEWFAYMKEQRRAGNKLRFVKCEIV